MVSRLGEWVSRVFGRYMPDPLIIAVLLTGLTVVLALAVGDCPSRPAGVSKAWFLLGEWGGGKGLWTFLAFSMQMCVVLVTGHALASSGPVRRMLEWVAARPRTCAEGAVAAAAVGCACSLVNWGLGLIAGAFVAREIGRGLRRRGVPVHYPILVAAGFAGFLPWHGGLSGSAPLSMTSAEAMAKVLPKTTVELLAAAGHGGGVPLGQSLLSPMNLVVTLGLVVLIPLCAGLLSPRSGQEMRPPPGFEDLDRDACGAVEMANTPSEWMETRRVVNVALGAALAAWLWVYVAGSGAGEIGARLQRVGLNEVNVGMLALGLLLHRSPRSYLAAAEEGARGCAGIILQFPLYGGIVAVLIASGLDRMIAEALVGWATARTLPVYTFWCASVLNIFIPSGGGQWGVQGPIAVQAGLEMGVAPGKMVMAVAYGDQLTNMLQPFWALPLLAITRAKAREIVGYTALIMLAAGMWITVVMLVV